MLRRIALSVAVVLAITGAIALGLGAEDEKAALVCPVDPITAFAERLQVGPPQRHGSLTLYPVFAEGATLPQISLTLDEAIERGLLEICELKPAQVNKVRLRSRAKEPIFVMGGEMLGGAKQDRIVGDDLIVASGADLVIPVFCVERGRWVAKSETFLSAKALAGSAVRKARQSADQSAVWENVAAEQSRLDAPSATGALRSIQDSEEVREQMKPYTHAFSDFAGDLPKARGVVACVGGEIIAADLFASRELFHQLWPKLLDSYITDAIGRPTAGRAPDAVRIKRWLDGIKRASRTPRDTPGEGALYELRGQSLFGSALVECGVVHIELFPNDQVRAFPFNRLEFRRERLEEQQQ
jgi:hypothetical protein